MTAKGGPQKKVQRVRCKKCGDPDSSKRHRATCKGKREKPTKQPEQRATVIIRSGKPVRRTNWGKALTVGIAILATTVAVFILLVLDPALWR